jgi:hypothetical protein
MLHAISLNKVVAILGLNLIKIVESFFILLVVTTTHQKELALRTIHALKVVWELVLALNLELLASLVEKIELENNPRIFLKQVDHGAWRTWILVATLTSKHGFRHTHRWRDIQVARRYRHHRLISVFTNYPSRGCVIRSLVASIAQTLLLVFGEFFVRINLFASIWALEPQMLEQIGHYLVWCIKNSHVVAYRAFKFILGNIYAILLRSGGEICDAISAATLHTLWTFKHVFFDHHANWTLKIFWASLKIVVVVKILNFELDRKTTFCFN